MTEEQKAAELAQAEADAKAEAEQKAKAERENETDEERESREAKEEQARLQVDHVAELKRLEERAKAAEKDSADKAFKLRELKRKQDEGGDDEDKPLTAKQLDDILTRNREETRKEIQSEIITEKAKKLAQTEDEAKLIIAIHKERSFPSYLSLDEQLEEAFAIANRKSLLAQNAELKRSLRGKDTISDIVAGTHRDSPALDEPKISSHDISAIKAAGFKWDGKTRLYTKQLGRGKLLTYDPKSKTQRV